MATGHRNAVRTLGQDQRHAKTNGSGSMCARSDGPQSVGSFEVGVFGRRRALHAPSGPLKGSTGPLGSGVR